MELTTDRVGDVTVVVLRGDHLDASITDEFKRDIGPILEESPKVVFDMSQLQFVDSSGLGAILSCLRRLGVSGGELKLSGMSKPVRAVFEISRMHRIIDIFATRDEALASFT